MFTEKKFYLASKSFFTITLSMCCSVSSEYFNFSCFLSFTLHSRRVLGFYYFYNQDVSTSIITLLDIVTFCCVCVFFKYTMAPKACQLLFPSLMFLIFTSVINLDNHPFHAFLKPENIL